MPNFARTLSGLLIPYNTLIGVLDEPLAHGVLYELTLGGIVNIAGLGGGGGVDTLLLEWPEVEEEDYEAEEVAEEADSVPPDSLETLDSVAPADGERRDTTAQDSVPPDTTLPDTAQAADSAASPDTLALPEGALPPDTTDQRGGQNGAIRPSGAASSPWIISREHRERRSAPLARRDDGLVAALPAQGATQSEARDTGIVNHGLHIVKHTLRYGQASEAVQRGCSAARMPWEVCPRASGAVRGANQRSGRGL